MSDQASEAQWLADAATGNVNAQAALAHLCIAHVATGVPVFEALAMAEPFARLAAEHGGAMEALLLADVLSMRSIEVRKAGYSARADAQRASALAIYDEVAVSADADEMGALVASLTSFADYDEAAAERLTKVIDRLSGPEARAATSAAKRRLHSASTYWAELAAIAAE